MSNENNIYEKKTELLFSEELSGIYLWNTDKNIEKNLFCQIVFCQTNFCSSVGNNLVSHCFQFESFRELISNAALYCLVIWGGHVVYTWSAACRSNQNCIRLDKFVLVKSVWNFMFMCIDQNFLSAWSQGWGIFWQNCICNCFKRRPDVYM